MGAKLIITATVFPAIALAFGFLTMLAGNPIWGMFIGIAILFQAAWLFAKFR